MTTTDQTDTIASMADALDRAAAEYGKHSGPSSDECERDAFRRDLQSAALRYARAYYAETLDAGARIAAAINARKAVR